MANTRIEIEMEDGKNLIFKKDRIRARWVKEVFKMEKKVADLGAKGKYEEALDARIQFVCDFFNDPNLTPDAIYDGIDSDKIVSELERITGDIVGRPDQVEGKL